MGDNRRLAHGGCFHEEQRSARCNLDIIFICCFFWLWDPGFAMGPRHPQRYCPQSPGPSPPLGGTWDPGSSHGRWEPSACWWGFSPGGLSFVKVWEGFQSSEPGLAVRPAWPAAAETMPAAGWGLCRGPGCTRSWGSCTWGAGSGAGAQGAWRWGSGGQRGRPRGGWEPVPGRWACEHSWGAGSSCGPPVGGEGEGLMVQRQESPLCALGLSSGAGAGDGVGCPGPREMGIRVSGQARWVLGQGAPG